MTRRLTIAFIAGLSLSGCAISQSTADVAINYNRSFAQTRNEMLLLNVLRASAREPLQFSTMGQVQGPVGNGGEISIPITNLIGGKDIISPTLKLTDAVNPNVSIIPLTNKEFAAGILSPIKLETIQLFTHSGWDANFLLPLVIGGVICPGKEGEDRELLLNSGEYLELNQAKTAMTMSPLHLAFRRFFFKSAKKFAVSTKASKDETVRMLTLADKEALTALKDGIGPKYIVEAVTEGAEGQMNVKIRGAETQVVQGFAFEELCDNRKAQLPENRTQTFISAGSEKGVPGYVESQGAAEGGSKKGTVEGSVVFRSVASIIHYLGESHRVRFDRRASDLDGIVYLNTRDEEKTLFRIEWGLHRGRDVTETRFHDTQFFIRQLDLRDSEHDDRTLKTLSFLDQLIALQTSESTVRGAQAIIALPQ
jgi:hypothetical protein